MSDAPQTEDEELTLVTAAIAGDRAAFTRLYDLHYDRIYRHVLYRVRSVQDAEDLSQQVFLQAWRAMERYRPTGAPFVAWLFTIAHNLTMSFYRHNKLDRRQEGDNELELEGVVAEGDPEEQAEARVDQDRVRAAIVKLRPEQQLVVSLRFLENLSHHDIAETLGKSEGAVRVIQHRALQELRRIMEREGANG
ncbi:MAG TPA: sigma-70 family RNA polymerase sigma factor [Chloroflexota bacterium]